jgi:ribonucleoside-diphosphate reductase alpha chain
MQRVAEVAPELVEQLAEHGARFTHHTSIAPTGTISLSLANNASNGIEPSFAHHYSRNVIREGKKSKEKVEVFSYELLAYRELINADALPLTDNVEQKLPEYFVSADDITPKEHVDIQAASQKWIDSSISKTANVPTAYPYEDFKDIYTYAHKQGLKGCTTFRFNPAAFQGVLVKEADLENTTYRFELEDGQMVEVKGNEQIEYDGEMHTAANLFDALKEGYYGKFCGRLAARPGRGSFDVAMRVRHAARTTFPGIASRCGTHPPKPIRGRAHEQWKWSCGHAVQCRRNREGNRQQCRQQHRVHRRRRG